jgi:4'-phosphopantetheinyl transferase
VDTIYPVILSVPEKDRLLRGRDKVARLSALARHAVTLSAQHARIKIDALMKSPEGVPLPSNGYHWSLSHKSEFVAGVAADFPVGLDIEKIRPCAPRLFQIIAGDDEWGLEPSMNDRLFFRFWTAKEAVLKSVGLGLKGLSQCRVNRISGDRFMELTFGDQRFWVQHFYFNDHIGAVLAVSEICWMVQNHCDLNTFE